MLSVALLISLSFVSRRCSEHKPFWQIRRIELYGPPLADQGTLFVEVVVLADYSFYKHYGTQRGASQRAAQLLSVANKVELTPHSH